MRYRLLVNLSSPEEAWPELSDFERKQAILSKPVTVKLLGANLFMKWATRGHGEPSFAQLAWKLGADWNPDQAHLEGGPSDLLENWMGFSSTSRIRECRDALEAYDEWAHLFQAPPLLDTFAGVEAEVKDWNSVMKPVPIAELPFDLSKHGSGTWLEDNEEVRKALADVDQDCIWSYWFDDQVQLVPGLITTECNGFVVTQSPSSEWDDWLVVSPRVTCPFCAGDAFTQNDVECPVCDGAGESVLYDDGF